ncbi:MAG: biotin--[acetyl-CoA-carboxylase] ligase [Clostridiales bacterium GWF2_38_85]|nr:MAG: biotin--[acetyl-CoA-carboxylase] ligase [Clostridiales bacterium GWF2_38_85]HBL83864.1 biotin--[acetyl-CoA-carboxylase] ligase [Clostridiales bacterium]
MPLKSEILKELEANRDTDLSGQMLAEKLSVSRNAVWKAVNTLKDEGYTILSGQNKGYRLAENNDLISAEGIKNFLCDKNKQLPVYIYKEIDSTNNEAKRLIANGMTTNALIAAETQTAGRGRFGRQFYSPEQTGIYMTLIVNPQFNINDAVLITSAASVAVVRTIEKLTDKKPQIKWVNDVYLDGKKICGILTEATTSFETGTVQSIIIGIGINISTADFPVELKDVAAALNPDGITRNKLIATIVDNLLELTDNLTDRSFLDDYRSHSLVIGKHIDYYKNGEKFNAYAAAIDDTGGLVIRNANGSEETLRSGEITVRVKR